MATPPRKFLTLRASFIVLGIFFCASIITFLFNDPHIVVITGGEQIQVADATSTTRLTSAFSSSTTSSENSSLNTAMLLVPMTPINKKVYDAKMLQLANLPPLPPAPTSTSATTTPTSTTTSTTPKKTSLWPVTSAPYPTPGALLPFNRIVAYYGNLYSRQMGVLGKYDPPEMLAMLASTTAQWAAADPSTPVIPALDYIAVVAQGEAGKDGKYRARMPDSEIDKVIALAAEARAIVILEIQVGLSDVQTELPLLERYLKLPQVHIALDPEFDVREGERPGRVIGSMSAEDINFAATYLSQLVKENNLPPKVLIVHRFTKDMVTGYKEIKPLPEVQIVIDMDGFGEPAKKIGTYKTVIVPEPVQFTGFKLFYKNDVVAGHLMTPEEVLELSPQPSFIQYQ